MAHLLSFRKGWENENLARFLLSKFSFIANPATISDDIGSDYYCTIFQILNKEQHKFLIPKNSFAIQIKSNYSKIDFTDKIGYLANLEIPFFIGVIDQSEMKLSIYSGEYFSQFISLKTPNKLTIELCERKDVVDNYFIENRPKEFTLKFPKVAEIRATVNDEELLKIVNLILDVCSITYENISSRKTREYIFYEYGTNRIQINAGKDSANTFRENFYKRLTENFINLKWMYERSHPGFNIEEFRVYENLLSQLSKTNSDIPQYVFDAYTKLKNIITDDSK